MRRSRAGSDRATFHRGRPRRFRDRIRGSASATRALRRSAFQEAIVHLGARRSRWRRRRTVARQATDGSTSPNQRLSSTSARRLRQCADRGRRGSGDNRSLRRVRRRSASGDKDATEQLAGELTVSGSAATCEAQESFRQRGPTPRRFSTMSRRDPIPPEAVGAHRIAGTTFWFAGGYHEARITSKGLPYFNRAVIMIWFFVSGSDVPASALDSISRSRCGCLGRADRARFPHRPYGRGGSRKSPMPAPSHLQDCTRPCSN